MLIVCITITKFKTTPAAKWQESQRWPRGNKREATGEEADQLPKTHSCLAGSVRDSESSVKTSIHHFWGRGGDENCHGATWQSLSTRSPPAVLLGTVCVVIGRAPVVPPASAHRRGLLPCSLCLHLLVQHPALLPARTPQHMHSEEQFCSLLVWFQPPN